MTERTKEPVRLPGIINMEMEADKLDPEKVRNLRLNIPLRISVDSCSASLDGGPLSTGKLRQRNPWVSPSAKSSLGRSESVESRQRKRTRDWLEGKMGGGRVRSASAGRDKRTEMAARYWAVLFENLRRAVDDLYRTCEGDESCIAAREVVMTLENYTKDFKNLINWLRLKIEYESTPQPQRPTSLTWDIRKTSPLGKMTPASTPGKLTPTRQLLLCSPAKRQLNFDENSEGAKTRSRQVSETIKEVGLELENSPHNSSLSLALDRQNLEPTGLVHNNIEECDNCSEHEKSDSEQEKDTPVSVVEVAKKLEAECELLPVPQAESQPLSEPPVTQVPPTEPEKKQPSKADTTPEKKVKGKLSKVTETRKKQSVLAKAGPPDKVGAASGASKSSTEKVSNVSKVGLADKVTKGGAVEKTGGAGGKVSTDKAGLTVVGKAGLSTGSKVSAAASEKSATASRREKSTEKPKTQSKPTTFASTVKTTLTKPSTLLIKQTVPRMTRALTTITAASKPKPPARKTAAGLLITTTPAARASPPLTKTAGGSKPLVRGVSGEAAGAGSASGSPKQQRISLVARQAKFASENKNPNRLVVSKSGAKSRPSTAPTHRSSLPPNPHLTNPVPHGSTTSLSSGSSGRSWADTVRGGPLPGLHCSAEDLSYVRSRGGSMVDSEGWCTVRRARARFSPSSNQGAVELSKGRNSTGKVNRAKNRFKMPSSAMSMPSLAFDEQTGDSESGPSRPVLEKSSSSASILRNGREKSHQLSKLVEKPGGSSAESLSGSDPSKIKMKKDQINLTKKKALKKNSLETPEDEGKSKVKKTSSCPESAAIGSEVGKGEETNNEIDEYNDKVVVDVTDTETEETESEEIELREKAIAKAELEVSDLQREIKETEQAELTDTDCDNDHPDTDNYTTDTESNDTRSEVGAVSDICSRYESLLDGLSWAEQLELEEQLGDPSTLEARLPGRAIQLHEKLSSPARKREPHETFKHYQEKQDKARLRRLRFTEQKASKLTILNMKIGEVIEQRDKLVDERKGMIESKLKKAEEKRIQHIEGIRKKAHKEEEKLKEIAFINELQAQNTRMDMMFQVEHADENCEERLAEIAGERAKKAEQREEREAKAEERRRAMEDERQKQKNAMMERRREKEERIQEEQAAAREQRKVSAAMKDRERLERLSTVRAAEKDMKEELQEKIQQKQEDAAKRHAENLEHIRQKAWELSVQKCSSDEGVPVIKHYQVKKKCEACNVLIRSEVHLLSHLRGKLHQEEISKKACGKDLSDAEKTTYNLKHIVDAPEGETDPKSVQARERVKVAKKKAKKLKTKMASKAAEYVAGLPPANKHLDSPNRARIGKSLREIDKLLSSQGKGAWPNNSVSALERHFGEIVRSFEKNSSKDQDVFKALGGFEIMEKIYSMLAECGGETTCVIPIKSLVSAGRVLSKATHNHTANTGFLMMSNRLTLIADILLDRLARLTPEQPKIEEVGEGPDTDPLSQSLMSLLSSNIQHLSKEKLDQPVTSRLQDMVSYVVCSGTVDSLANYFQLVRDPIDSSPEVAEFLLTALQLLTSLTAAIEQQQGIDPTHLLAALQGTELAGTVSMLYGMLLHQGRDSDRDSIPPALPQHTLAVAMETCTLLHRLVRDQHRMGQVQTVLGSEGISLEFRHIASYLLYYCQHHSETELLNQVIVLVGYFTANHPDNQSIVQSGSQPSVLQQLASLPFQYFSQTELKAILFPTLLSSCYNCAENSAILSQEMSWQLIDEFVESEEGKGNLLVQLVTGARQG